VDVPGKPRLPAETSMSKQQKAAPHTQEGAGQAAFCTGTAVPR